MCLRKIAIYQSPRGADRLTWKDVALAKEEAASYLNRSNVLAHVHVRTLRGTLVLEAHGFALMWPTFSQMRGSDRNIAARPILCRWSLLIVRSEISAALEHAGR